MFELLLALMLMVVTGISIMTAIEKSSACNSALPRDATAGVIKAQVIWYL